MHFIVSTASSKPPDAAARKLIRRHVMIGKNRGRTHPNRRSALRSSYNNNDKKEKHELEDAKKKKRNDVRDPTDATILFPNKYTISRLDSSLHTLCLPVEVPVSSINQVIQMSKFSKQLMFPLVACIFFDRRAESWIRPMMFDTVYLHVLVSAAERFSNNNDIVMRGQIFVQAIRCLNERLSNDKDALQLADSTIASIVSITGFALLQHDYAEMKRNLLGLKTMISCRGGIQSFDGNRKLFIEILRLDIGLSLVQGTNPLLSDLVNLDHPALPLFAPRGNSLNLVEAKFDKNLQEAVSTLRTFVGLVQVAYESERLIMLEDYLAFMSSIFYKLLPLSYAIRSADEILRLALLTFSSTIFLQWKQLALEYTWLLSSLAEAIKSEAFRIMDPSLGIWITTIAAIACKQSNLEHSSYLSFARELSHSGIDSLDGLRVRLGGLPWVGFLLDGPAKLAFENAFAGPAETTRPNNARSSPKIARLKSP